MSIGAVSFCKTQNAAVAQVDLMQLDQL